MSSKGRVYRRCACRDEDGKQLGARCPLLKSDSKHGTWTFAVDVPDLVKKRKTIRRGGFATKRAAQAELDKVLDRTKRGVQYNDRLTVADFFAGWLEDKQLVLKPKTYFGYERYVRLDIVPALGVIPLEHLHHDHIRQFFADMRTAGRGDTTIRRIKATLSSALSDAVDQHRITYNPVKTIKFKKPEKIERRPWTTAQAVAFLAVAKQDRLGPLFQLLMECGLRRGEALALRWEDVDLDARVLFVRHTVSEVGGRLVYGAPKTKASEAGVGMSDRVVAALRIQQARQAVERAEWAEAYEDNGLVFSRENGGPLWPKAVLTRFKSLSEAAGVPLIRVHDLRHMAATVMIGTGVPLAIVSKTLRHSRVGITADLYGHLTRDVAVEAADAMGSALDAADAERLAVQRAKEVLSPTATTLRPQSPRNDSAGLPVQANPLVNNVRSEGFEPPTF